MFAWAWNNVLYNVKSDRQAANVYIDSEAKMQEREMKLGECLFEFWRNQLMASAPDVIPLSPYVYLQSNSVMIQDKNRYDNIYRQWPAVSWRSPASYKFTVDVSLVCGWVYLQGEIVQYQIELLSSCAWVGHNITLSRSTLIHCLNTDGPSDDPRATFSVKFHKLLTSSGVCWT